MAGSPPGGARGGGQQHFGHLHLRLGDAIVVKLGEVTPATLGDHGLEDREPLLHPLLQRVNFCGDRVQDLREEKRDEGVRRYGWECSGPRLSKCANFSPIFTQSVKYREMCKYSLKGVNNVYTRKSLTSQLEAQMDMRK